MSSNLMETSPGGQNTQYESIKTVTEEPAKQEGTMGKADTASNDTTSSPEQLKQDDPQRGEKTAENIRYGQAVSESGMGGMTNLDAGC
ncbi:MAG: hypothetical protein M1819_007436 [Sarea resinae]|nr:MAG: hypothetical protein M1819_007436 [Sarea resinae]